MIDAIALIMTLEQAGLDQFRGCTAEVGLARCAHPGAHFILHSRLVFHGVSAQPAVAAQLLPHSLHQRHPARIALAHRRQCVAQPVPQRHQSIFDPNHRPSAAVRSRHIGDQRQQHEGVARARAAMRQLIEQQRNIAAAGDAGRNVRMKHIVNQAQSGTDVNPLFSTSRTLSAVTLCPTVKCHAGNFTSRADSADEQGRAFDHCRRSDERGETGQNVGRSSKPIPLSYSGKS